MAEGLSVPGADIAQEQSHLSWRMRLAEVALVCGASAMALAGCSGESQPNPPAAGKTPIPASPAETAAAENACGGSIDLGANQADTKFGSNTSEFPSLLTKPDANGKQELVSTTTAADTLKEQLRNDSRVLAVFTAFFMETRNTKQLPDTDTLGQAKQLMDSTYKINQDKEEQDLTKACAAIQPDFLIPTTTFAVTHGQYMDVVAEHDKTTNTMTGFKTVKGNATQNLEGFMLSYNKDDASLTAEQKAIYDKLSQLILITNDGNIVVNLTFGESAITIEQNQTPTSVTVSPNASNSITFSPSPTPSSEQQNNNSSSNNSNNNGSTGGSVSTGKQPENQPGPATGPQPSDPAEATQGKHKSPNGGETATPTAAPTTGEQPSPTPSPTTTHPETTPPPAPTPPPTTPPPSETTPPPPPTTPAPKPTDPPTNPN